MQNQLPSVHNKKDLYEKNVQIVRIIILDFRGSGKTPPFHTEIAL